MIISGYVWGEAGVVVSEGTKVHVRQQRDESQGGGEDVAQGWVGPGPDPREAIGLHLEGLQAEGERIPQPVTESIQIEVAA
ncbi:MAG: hypothetical protein O3C45_00365 [Bacteroidetes bacterium]|nr:hypothetical protein [Bacteroidota bacterium]MDA0873493.1 hypothetical protein [Bacteroidota bacterium]